MDVRTPWLPDDGQPGAGSGGGPGGTAGVPGAGPAGSTVGPDGELRWRVNTGLTALKSAGAVLFLVAGLVLAANPVGVAMGVLAAAALGAFALRDVIAPIRLTADPAGLTVVSGYAGRRRLAWADVERIRVDQRRRLGTRTQLLEIDSSDTLHLFSGYELCAPVADVAALLTAMRTAA